MCSVLACYDAAGGHEVVPDGRGFCHEAASALRKVLKDATVWRDPRFTELLLQALAGQAFAVTITWIAVALSLWGAMSTGAVVAGSLSCLVSIPLYYVLERKLVKG